MPADAPSPADLAMVRERTQRYEAALLRLRQDDRDLIVSRLELGLTYEEIAASSDKPTANAARSAVVRALVRLTEELSRGSS
jgi:RNA polymerase sigma-70 factor (ECF subfamily)